MPKARTRKKAPPADLGDVETDRVEATAAEIVGPPAPERVYDKNDLPETRPALIGSRERARALRTDDWVEVRCIVGNVHTSVGKLVSGQVEFVSPEEAELLDRNDQIKRV